MQAFCQRVLSTGTYYRTVSVQLQIVQTGTRTSTCMNTCIAIQYRYKYKYRYILVDCRLQPIEMYAEVTKASDSSYCSSTGTGIYGILVPVHVSLYRYPYRYILVQSSSTVAYDTSSYIPVVIYRQVIQVLYRYVPETYCRSLYLASIISQRYPPVSNIQVKHAVHSARPYCSNLTVE